MALERVVTEKSEERIEKRTEDTTPPPFYRELVRVF